MTHMPPESAPDPGHRRDHAGRLVVGRHATVVAAAHDPVTFSNAVSRHRQVPNGLDGAEHAGFRAVLDPFFEPDRMRALEPGLAELAGQVVAAVASGKSFDAVGELGSLYAVRAQSRWLGWRSDLEQDLLDWVADNRAATRAGDRDRILGVAARFDQIIRSLLDERRRPGAPPDLTTELMELHGPDGSPLSDEDLVSVLRNWTGGDLSSLALCAGVVVHWLATHRDAQPGLAAATDADLDAAIDEMLRLDDPFVANRRIATRDTEISGCPVAAGEHVLLDWREANLDPEAFDDPHAFDPHANAAANLVYGTGPHVCPGRPLATLELRVLTRALLGAGRVELDESQPAVREEAPVAGFRSVWVRLVD